MCLTAPVVGAVCLLTAALTTERSTSPLLALAFALALAGAQVMPLHLPRRGQSEALHLEEVVFVPMILMLSATELLAAVALGVAVANVVTRRSLLKVAFNSGMLTTSAAAGLLTARLLGAGGEISGRDLVAATVGGLVHCGLSALLVSAVIALATGTSVRQHLQEGLPVRAATWLGSLSLGLLVVLAAQAQPFGLALSVVPVLVLQYAYSGATRQWRERRQAEELYEAAARIRSTVSTQQVMSELVGSARGLLAAGSARVVQDAAVAVPRGALRVPLGQGEVIEVGDRATGGRWTRDDRSRLQALVAVATGALDIARLYEQLHAVTDSLGEGVLAFDPRGLVTFANPAAHQMLGWPDGELVGVDVAVGVDPGCRTGLAGGSSEWAHLATLRAGRTLRLDEHSVARRDGTVLDVALTASPVLQDGVMVGAVVALRDVTERKALENRLVHQALHDQLTGLPSRALFLDRLEHARTRPRAAAATQAVLFIDVDRFKQVNDSLGHRVGDDVLCAVASRLVSAVRGPDTVARFGGDEFAVLLEGLAHPSEAIDAAQRMLRALRAPIVAGDRSIVLSVSIGIAVAELGKDAAALLAAADSAMYDAKRSGKDRYCIAAPDADEHAKARLDQEVELRRAIEHGELELDYQPVVEAQGGRLYGFEALVRWRHPTRGLLAPGTFMELAEETGLVLPLGEWVLERACRTAREWADRHPTRPIVMAVNLSSRQFQDPDLCARVAAVLTAVGLTPSSLVLEITETVVMGDTDRTLSTLRALKRLGVRLAIDDFGTGYSSLSYLKRFPVDVVKIDKSFVDGLGDSPVDREIVLAVIRLASAVGMQTVAEGVETVAQLDELRSLGCTMVQGFLLARPLPGSELDSALAMSVPAPRSA